MEKVGPPAIDRPETILTTETSRSGDYRIPSPGQAGVQNKCKSYVK
jgi:hypothetical protein